MIRQRPPSPPWGFRSPRYVPVPVRMELQLIPLGSIPTLMEDDFAVCLAVPSLSNPWTIRQTLPSHRRETSSRRKTIRRNQSKIYSSGSVSNIETKCSKERYKNKKQEVLEKQEMNGQILEFQRLRDITLNESWDMDEDMSPRNRERPRNRYVLNCKRSGISADCPWRLSNKGRSRSPIRINASPEPTVFYNE